MIDDATTSADNSPVQQEFHRERGATATEYALLVGLIALIIVVGVGAFGQNLNSFFSSLASTVGTW